MTYNFRDKTSSPRHPDVISAKVPEWLFESVEGFKNEYDLKCRNAAIVALLALGLRSIGKLEKEQCQDCLFDQGCGGIFER